MERRGSQPKVEQQPSEGPVNETKDGRPLVLLLGAGASLGARPRWDTLPPLGSRLGCYLRTWLDANNPTFAEERLFDPTGGSPLCTGERLWVERLLPELRESLDEVASVEKGGNLGQRTPFEILMDGWFQRKDGKDLLIVAQTLLAYAFLVGRACAFHERQDLLDQLVARLPANRPTIVITLNYDLLLEDALKRAGRRYTYPSVPGVEGTIFVSEGQGEAIQFFKIHGSINWLSLRSCGVSADLEVARQSTRSVKYIDFGSFPVAQTYATYVTPNRAALFFELERHLSAQTPVAAIYGTGKQVIENPEHVDEHRRACCAQICQLAEADVLAVGLRRAAGEDDPILHELLVSLSRVRGEKTCVNFSANDCEQFESLGYKAIQTTLEDWLTRT